MKLFDFFKRSSSQTPVSESVSIRGESSGRQSYFDVAPKEMYENIFSFEQLLPTSVSGPESGLKIATVFRCVDVLSKGVASLPLRVMKKEKGYFVPDEEHSLNSLLTLSPNGRQTGFELMANAIIQKVCHGNAYIIPRYNFDLDEEELILCSPGTVAHDVVNNNYIVNDHINKIHGQFSCEDLIHLKNFSLDGGYSGVSTIRYASTVLSIAASSDRKTYDTLQPGDVQRGFISGENTNAQRGTANFQNSQFDTVAIDVEKKMKEGKKIFSIPQDVKFNQLSIPIAELQLLENKKFTVPEICRFFGVHPDKVFQMQSNNYKSSEMSQVLFLSDTLQPILREIEMEFTKKLIPRKDWAKLKIEFDLEGIYQTDLTTMALYMEKSIGTGVMTINDWRRKKGLPAIEGGDTVMISCNVAPIDSEKINGGQKTT